MDDRYYVSHRTASQLTGLSQRQLQTWDRVGVLRPSIVDRDRRPVLRMYAYEDLIASLLLVDLEGMVPLEQMRKVQPWIQERRTAGWANLWLIVCNQELILVDGAENGRGTQHPCDDGTLTVDVEQAVQRLRAAIDRSRQRDPSNIGTISRSRDIMQNEWVLAGTRVPTKSVWEMRDEGSRLDVILRQFPQITAADVEAAIAHEERLRRKGAA